MTSISRNILQKLLHSSDELYSHFNSLVSFYLFFSVQCDIFRLCIPWFYVSEKSYCFDFKMDFEG